MDSCRSSAGLLDLWIVENVPMLRRRAGQVTGELRDPLSASIGERAIVLRSREREKVAVAG
jgi:hypothetical protein